MNILVWPQNNSHLENMLPIGDYLESIGNKVTYLDTGNLFHQDVSMIAHRAKIVPNFSFPISFYKMNRIGQIKGVLSFTSFIKNKLDVAPFDILIVGNDGALQRSFIRQFKGKDKRVVLLLDGMISDYSVSLSDIVKNSADLKTDFTQWLHTNVKKFLSKMVRNSYFAVLMPSIIGGSKGIDEVFTIGKHSAEVVKKVNPEASVYSIGLPRFWKQEYRDSITSSIDNKVCYFPSAFKWHGLSKEDVQQHQDIDLCCRVISSINSTIPQTEERLSLTIKIHPREDKADYEVYEKTYPFVHTVQSMSIEECIQSHGVLLSNISTVITEGFSYGRCVWSLMIHFQFWKYKKSFLASDLIRKVFSEHELIELLKNEGHRNETQALCEEPAINYFCSTIPKLKEVCDLIVSGK